tara:strand:- start:5 stop:628 length:624 start_codon:yes stop_codon:yes gene_type:complete
MTKKDYIDELFDNKPVEMGVKLKPALLQHPNIPPPLHGLAPRVIKGQDWWDETRQDAYASTNYHCLACGVHKNEAKYHQWLEAHEDYTIDYENGIMNIKEIIPLCHSCHNFIHCGRLIMVNQKTKQGLLKILEILNHGMTILRENNLPMHFHAGMMCDYVGINYECDVMPEEKTKVASWNKWHLILDGQKYYSKFKNNEEWAKYYNN